MSARTSKKRASPGADVEKNGDPLQDVELGDEDAKNLNDVQKEIQRVELILGSESIYFPCVGENADANDLAERRAQQALTPVYQKRREVLKAINKFWPVALMNHAMFAVHAQHDADRTALSYLEDVWIVRDAREPKVFTLEFVRFTPVMFSFCERAKHCHTQYFKENPYFADSVLKKVYEFVPSRAVEDEKPDADGITPSMLEFSWERDVVPKVGELYPMTCDCTLIGMCRPLKSTGRTTRRT